MKNKKRVNYEMAINEEGISAKIGVGQKLNCKQIMMKLFFKKIQLITKLINFYCSKWN